MLDEKTRAQFRKWGAEGGNVRASKYTKRQLSQMVKRALRKKKGAKK